MHRIRFLPGIVREQGPLLLLIVTMFLIWLGQEIGPAGWTDPYELVPAHVVESWRQLRAGAVDRGDLATFGTLVTHAFLHGGISHVFGNMLYIWIFGALVVEYLGQRWFASIFLLSALGGGTGQTLLEPSSMIPAVGASGALMGLEGAYLGLALTRQLPSPHIWPMAHPIPSSQLGVLAAIGLMLDFHDVFAGRADFIAHGAHIGGFVVGFFITSIVLPRDAGR